LSICTQVFALQIFFCILYITLIFTVIFIITTIVLVVGLYFLFYNHSHNGIFTLNFFFYYRQEFKNRAKSLEYLSGIITDLYVDWHRLQGVDSRTKIPALQHIILSSGSSFDDLIVAFFNLPISNAHQGFNR
jgi:hypothetical protein